MRRVSGRGRYFFFDLYQIKKIKQVIIIRKKLGGGAYTDGQSNIRQVLRRRRPIRNGRRYGRRGYHEKRMAELFRRKVCEIKFHYV